MADKDYWSKYENPTFEDETPTQKAMNDYWHKYEAPKSKEGWGGVWRDIKNTPSRVGKNLGGVYESAKGFPAELEAAMKQPFHRKIRSALGGVAGVGKSIADVPANVASYLASHGIIDEDNPIANFRSPVDIQNGLGLGEEQPGDALTRGIGAGLTTGGLFGRSPKGFIPGIGIEAIGNNQDPLAAMATAGIIDRLVKTGLAAPKYARSLSPRMTADDILKHYSKNQDYFRRNYERILNDPSIGRPSYISNVGDLAAIEEHAAGYMPRVRDFMNNPTALNAHWAQSDLGRLINWVNDHENTALPGMKLARTAAKPVQEEIKQNLQSVLQNANPQVAAEYSSIGPQYSRTMGPYLSSDKLKNALRLYEDKRAGPMAVINAARGTPHNQFGYVYGKKFPGLKNAVHEQTRKNIPGIGHIEGLLKMINNLAK